jgi:hypothetical protein
MVLATTPTLVTPILGVATASSLAIAGCTIGTDELCVTGQTTLSSTLTLSSISGSTQCLHVNTSGVVSGTGSDCGAGSSGITIGTTTITSGTTTRILYDNAGVVGEYTLTGTGTVVAMQTSPALVTPALGVATATSIAVAGCTIGTDELCVTGQTTLSSTLTLSSITGSTQCLHVDTSGVVSGTGSDCGSGGGGSPGGSDTQVQFNDGGAFGGDAALVWNKTDNTLTLAAGTLGADKKTLVVTATQPTTPTTTQIAADFQITSAGSAAIANYAMRVAYLAGFTGNALTAAFQPSNAVAGTGALSLLGEGVSPAGGNYGIYATAVTTTTGGNMGVMALAANGDKNVGVFGSSNFNKTNATNIGVAGTGVNTSSGAVRIGGHFAVGDVNFPTVSAALIASNSANTDPIFLARDGTTTIFAINDNGATGGTVVASMNSALSSPAITATGTWITGGSATTTKPHVLIEPTGTTSTGWSTAGTGLGINAATGFAGRLIDGQINGTNVFYVESGVIHWTNSVNSSILSWNDHAMTFRQGGVSWVQWLGQGITVWRSDGQIGWGSGANFSADTYIARNSAATVVFRDSSGVGVTGNWLAAKGFVGSTTGGILTSPTTATLQLGNTDTDLNSNVVAQNLRTQGPLAGGTTNQAGKDFTILVSPGKGTGAGGAFVLQTAPAGGSGTSINAGVTAFKIDGAGLITYPTILTDSGKTTSTVCQDTTTHGLYFGSGALGVCAGTSSMRYKHDIKPLKSGLAEIMKLDTVSFFFNQGYGDNGATEKYGFTAENMLKPLPKLVNLDAEGKPSTIDWSGLLPVIVNAIKELKADNDNLRAQIRKLSARK